jgi:hypothetical protein
MHPATTRDVTSSTPTSSIETVTPELAQQWLGTNLRNRNLRPGGVAQYARDMESGRWRFTGEPIKFSVDGALLDGQHRLHAVFKSGVTLPMLVVRGLPAESQTFMDTGLKRTAPDALALMGEKQTSVLSSVAGMVVNDGARMSRRVSHAEILEVLAAEPLIRTITTEIMPALKLTCATPAVLGYAYWRLDKVSPDDTAKFFGALSSLAGLPAGSPVLALHKRLSGYTRGGASRGRSYRQESLACIFMAWNAWRRNEARSIIKLAVSADGRYSIPEPR